MSIGLLQKSCILSNKNRFYNFIFIMAYFVDIVDNSEDKTKIKRGLFSPLINNIFVFMLDRNR